MRLQLTVPVLLLLLLSLLAPSARADLNRFKAAWAEAGDDAFSQKEALDHLRGEGERGAKILLQIATNPEFHYQVSDKAMSLLAELNADGRSHLIDLMDSRSSRKTAERVICARVLGRIPGPGPRDALIEGLDDKSWEVRSTAALALSNHKSKAAIEGLIKALLEEDEDDRVRSDIVNSLEKLTNQRGLHEGADWDSWWQAHKDDFDVDNPPARQSEGEGKRTVGRLQNLYKEIDGTRIIFVLDASGSMQVQTSGDEFQGRSRLDYVKLELADVIDKELSRGRRFNIIVFSDEARAWKNRLQTASDSAKRRAIGFVKKVQCTEQNAKTPWQAGATNSHAALMLALDDPDVDTIYFLSDGTPTVGESIDFTEILGQVRKRNRTRNVRINTIAFVSGDGAAYGVVEDKSSARSFMRQLAQQNGGTFTNVE